MSWTCTVSEGIVFGRTGCSKRWRKNCPLLHFSVRNCWWQHCGSGSELTLVVPITNAAPAHRRTPWQPGLRVHIWVCVFMHRSADSAVITSFSRLRALLSQIARCDRTPRQQPSAVRAHARGLYKAQTCTLLFACLPLMEYCPLFVFLLDCSSLSSRCQTVSRSYVTHRVNRPLEHHYLPWRWQSLLLFPLLLCLTLFYLFNIAHFYPSCLVSPTPTVQHSTPPLNLTGIRHPVGVKTLTLPWWRRVPPHLSCQHCCRCALQ